MAKYNLSSPHASRSVRALVALLVLSTAISPVSVAVASTVSSATAEMSVVVETTPPPPVPAVTVNRTVPRVSPVPTVLTFSSRPAEAELRRARVFAEPLTPLGRTTPGENAALAAALIAYVKAVRTPDATAALERFLNAYPNGVWCASLRANLGAVYAADGALSRAMDSWDAAWRLAAHINSDEARAVAFGAVGEWLDMRTKLGDVAAAEARLAELGPRVVTGPAAVRVRTARERVAMMRAEPERGINPGAFAAAAVLDAISTTRQGRDAYARALATRAKPRSLSSVRALAATWRLSLRAVRLLAGAPIPSAAVVQWRAGHVGAIVGRDGERFLVRDAYTWRGRWVPRETVESESTGVYLVPSRLAPSEATSVPEAALAIQGWQGTCPPGAPDPDDPCPCENNPAGPSNGMAVYWFHPLTTGIRIEDTPVGYTPARGPDAHFAIRYNQDDQRLPQTSFFGNLGPQWSHNWLSFVTEEQLPGGANVVHVYLRGSGIEVYSGADANGVFPAHKRSRAVLVRTSIEPSRFERRLPDGGVEVFAQADGPLRVGRRTFLTEVRDAQGQSITLTYDAQLRLLAAADAVGQITAFTYAHATDPLKLTQVTDPFGRSANLAYDTDGRLSAITDAVGLTSRFAYDANYFVSALTTPYGTTSFRHETPAEFPFTRWVEATDPLGATRRMEYNYSATTGLPSSAPESEVPVGVLVSNVDLNRYNSYYWDKRAHALYPGDRSKAVQTHWLFGNTGRPNDPLPAVSLPHSVKRPLETRVWYRYDGQVESMAGAANQGVGSQPTVAARVLDDASTQAWLATYNAKGNQTSATDPLGRRTSYLYAANGIDLLEVRQTTGTLNDLLASYGSYTALHQAQTITDASGQMTTLTYSTTGRLMSRTNPLNETTTYSYDEDDRLISYTAPIAGATTSYAYDLKGRLRTLTDADGYSITIDYDDLDRQIRQTYPDGTYEETIYDRLDAIRYRDRLGRVTHRAYDSVRRLISTRDAAGRVTRQEWCGCGSLDALIDARGQKTSWLRDAQGRVVDEVRADGTTTTHYTYDTAGRIKSITDPKLQVTTYTYAPDNATLGIGFTNSVVLTPSVSYTYDAAYPRRLSMLDGVGETTYVYHPVGIAGATQVAVIDGPLANDTIAYLYDALGRITQRAVNGATNTVTYAYDALGRVTSEIGVLGTFTFGYDGLSMRLASIAYPNGQTSTYTYQPAAQDRRLGTIHHRYPNASTLSRFDYTYDALGKVLTWRKQAGNDPATVWEYGYDNVDQLTRASEKTTEAIPTLLRRYSWGYDPAGNRIFEQVDDTVTGWTYDSLNRPTTQYGGGTLRFGGTVSEPATVVLGGRSASVSPAGAFEGGVHVAAGENVVTVQATDAAGNSTTARFAVAVGAASKTFAFDANSNLSGDGARAFEWNARNELVAITDGLRTTEFGYDGLRRRVRRVEKYQGVLQSDARMLWDQESIAEERRLGDGEVTVPTLFGDRQGGVGRFAVTDHLGSRTEITDAQGTLATQYSYDPWGRRTSTAGQVISEIGFTSHRLSTADVWLTLYRAYDPGLGRWISDDPAGLKVGINLQAYVGNNPVKFRDPLGLCPCDAACPDGLWAFHSASAGLGLPVLGMNLGIGVYRCIGKPAVHRYAKTVCVVWGAVWVPFNAGAGLQLEGYTQKNVCDPSGLKDIMVSSWWLGGGPFSADFEGGIGLGFGPGGGVGRQECRITPI